MTIKHKSPFGEYELTTHISKYANGQTKIQLYDVIDGMPYATATAPVEDGILKEGEVAIKDWSENAGILNTLIDSNIVEEPHAYIESGYVKVPICKLKA